jgi:glycine/D-amino acid oxidase-like deaminating enzyme
VVIVGGGFTGLWTAYHLTERSPGLDIVLLEADICGGGASGRNGGLVTGWWDELDRLVELFGPDEGIRLARALGTAIQDIGAWCRTEGRDAWYRQDGYVATATTPAQAASLRAAVDVASRWGVADELYGLTADEVRQRCDSPTFGAGFLMHDGATVQPARLARALREVVLERGVRIFERTRVREIREGPPTVMVENGSVRAEAAVLAVNAWANQWPATRRFSVPRGSYMVLTEPLPDRLEQLGWTNGTCFTDGRTAVHYFRTTEDGRIAFGGGGASTGFGRSIGRTFTHDRRAAKRTADGFRRLFPTLSDVELTDVWGGPIDVGPAHLPTFSRIGQGTVAAVGYTGNGVGPAMLGGRVISGMVLDVDDEWTTLPLVDFQPQRYPVDPMRSLGAWVINKAVVRRDVQDEVRGRVGPITNFMARLPARLGYSLPPDA